MSRVHIKGFGLIGSLLAWELTERKIDFTWEDNETPGAWKASTGCIYPSGEPLDAENYNLWLKAFSSGFSESPYGAENRKPIELFAEAVPYGFTQKNIPHGNNSKELRVVESVGNIKILNKQSMHVNVQKFVDFTQKFFYTYRTQQPNDALIVHAHGFHKFKTTDYRWGWSVECNVSGPVFDKYPRFCLNAKEGRFINAYLYPKPTTPHYYLGTHFIYQRQQKQLEIGNKIQKIIEHIKKVTDGTVNIELTADPVTGWRPAYTEDFAHSFILDGGNNLYVTPKAANGLRHAPSYIQEIADVIQENMYASTI
jgi:hypothetical protein